MRKILVLATDYPNSNGGVNLMYVHTRNIGYIKNGIDVTVLNFCAEIDYIIDDIKVISLNSYIKTNSQYDILVLHAANLRNHYMFLLHYGKRFGHFVFFYHGHEVLRINSVYSKPYPYIRQSKIKFFFQDCYDSLKLFVWRHYLQKVAYKSDFIFVSQWMYDEFLKNTKIDPGKLKGKYSITYNSVGNEFESLRYNDFSDKEFDFITIRANLDGSKYSIDIVNRLAMNSPTCKFLVVGKGEFFEHYEMASNITWINKTMSHEEIIQLLNKARFALMPTKTDSQGLMMCEMAAFGIPVITSNIPVCHEIFDGFINAYFIDNDDLDLSLNEYKSRESHSEKDTRYYLQNTIVQELLVLKKDLG